MNSRQKQISAIKNVKDEAQIEKGKRRNQHSSKEEEEREDE